MGWDIDSLNAIREFYVLGHAFSWEIINRFEKIISFLNGSLVFSHLHSVVISKQGPCLMPLKLTWEKPNSSAFILKLNIIYLRVFSPGELSFCCFCMKSLVFSILYPPKLIIFRKESLPILLLQLSCFVSWHLQVLTFLFACLPW
jgi:hypothetical protein